MNNKSVLDPGGLTHKHDKNLSSGIPEKLFHILTFGYCEKEEKWLLFSGIKRTKVLGVLCVFNGCIPMKSSVITWPLFLVSSAFHTGSLWPAMAGARTPGRCDF